MLRSLIMSQSQSPATLIWEGEGGMPQININRNRPLGPRFPEVFGRQSLCLLVSMLFFEASLSVPTISQQNLQVVVENVKV